MTSLAYVVSRAFVDPGRSLSTFVLTPERLYGSTQEVNPCQTFCFLDHSQYIQVHLYSIRDIISSLTRMHCTYSTYSHMNVKEKKRIVYS